MALGSQALYSNSNGGSNIGIGHQALRANSTTSNNTAIGHTTLRSTTAGNNTALGYGSGYSNSTGSGNIFIGYSAGYSETASNKLYIENSNSASPLIWGDFNTDVVNINGSLGIGTTAPGSALDVKGTLRLSGATSGYVGLAPAAVANNAIDGSDATSVAFWSNDSGQWLRVDLGSAKTIASYRLKKATNLTGFRLWYSTNDTDWVVADEAKSNAQADVTFTLPAQIAARYWKLIIDVQDWSALYTMELRTPIVTSPQPLAIGSTNQVLSINGDMPVWSDLATVIGSIGNVGIGTTNQGAALSVSGGEAIGSAYKTAAISDGNLVIAGQVGIGTTVPAGYSLDIMGGNPTIHLQPSVGETTTYMYFQNNGQMFVGVERSTGGALFPEATAYASVVGSISNHPLMFGTNHTIKMTLNTSGNLGIGTTDPTQALEVNGGIRQNTVTAKPTCDATTRGTTWFTQGGAGVKDSYEVCAKDAADTYSWRTIY